MMKLLDIVTQFTEDVGMTFGESKCAFQMIERGVREQKGEPVEINGLTIKEIENGYSYRYLGTDETVGALGPLNKDKVTKEYKKRVRKIWNSDLNGQNKVTAHNTFAVPIITPTIGILDWTKKEIEDLDIMTRKTITMTGGLHPASDVNRLYTDCKKGGRGLRNIEDMYEARYIGLMKHLEEGTNGNTLLELVTISEKEDILRLGKELEKRLHDIQDTGKDAERMRKEQEKKWKEKTTHGYLQRQTQEDNCIDQKATQKWLKLRLTSHVEGFVMAVQEQEIDTKETRKRREKNPEKKRSMDTCCRVCHRQEESTFHLVCSCPVLAPTLYLHSCHNQVTRVIYQEILESDKPIYNLPRVTTRDQLEIWWDMEVYTTTKVKHNKPDIMLWKKEEKTCQLVECTVPLDTNLAEAYHQKEIKYIPLISELQRMYHGYKFSTVIITIGALGAVPKSLATNLGKMPLNKDRIEIIIQRLQRAALIGTLKVCKTVLKM